MQLHIERSQKTSLRGWRLSNKAWKKQGPKQGG